VDCEKFDKVALEMLYDELDELTSAAAKRHMDHCSRCGTMGARLRATREVGVLPILAPPVGLEERILRLERQARQGLPLRQRVGRGISVLAGYAMRPQLAMAALLVLMLGSSFLFLRSKPGDADSVHVTERGVREADESIAIVPLPEPQAAPATAAPRPAPEAKKPSSVPPRAVEPAPAAAEVSPALEAKAGNDAYDQAMSAYRRGDYASAEEQFQTIAAAGGEQAPAAQLYAAHAARNSAGCDVAAPKFDAINAKYPGSNVAQEAVWQAATCYRTLGLLDVARARYQLLLDVPAYADRAQHALLRLNPPPSEVVAARKAAPAAAKEPARSKATQSAAPPATRADGL
jgi:TolA-binding protein